MRALVQRVSHAGVKINGNPSQNYIGKGLVVFVGVGKGDTQENGKKISDKIVNLRVFENESGKLDLSLKEIQGEILVVSQFTLYADCSQGRRPDFTQAESPERTKALYENFVQNLKESGLPVKEGIFGARMEVELVNDGPLTLSLES